MSKYELKELSYLSFTASQGSRTPNDVLNVSTSVLLTLLMPVSAVRNIE